MYNKLTILLTDEFIQLNLTQENTQMDSFLKEVFKSASKKILFLPHAVSRMNKAEPMISTDEIQEVLLNSEIIEDYPEDVRGHSCLLFGLSNQQHRPIHIVCSPKTDYLAIITVYVPSPNKWSLDLKKRKE